MGKIVKHLKYTLKELKSYCADERSCVKYVSAEKIHIGLAPHALGNFQESVTNALGKKKIGRYDVKLDGIVLDVRNIKVIGNQFHMHNDSSALHINLYADLYVFQPTVGAIVNGIIKHIAYGHISVTIHRVFNVSILLNNIRRDLEVNNEISVKITKFNFEDSMPYIEGVIHNVNTKKTVFQDNYDHSVLDSGISTVGSNNKSSVSDSSSDDDCKTNFIKTRVTHHSTFIKRFHYYIITCVCFSHF